MKHFIQKCITNHSWETSAINMGSLNAVKLIKYLLIKFMIKIITRNWWISECLIYFTFCSEHWSRPSGAILVRHGSLNKDPHTTFQNVQIVMSFAAVSLYIYGQMGLYNIATNLRGGGGAYFLSVCLIYISHLKTPSTITARTHYTILDPV